MKHNFFERWPKKLKKRGGSRCRAVVAAVVCVASIGGASPVWAQNSGVRSVLCGTDVGKLAGLGCPSTNGVNADSAWNSESIPSYTSSVSVNLSSLIPPPLSRDKIRVVYGNAACRRESSYAFCPAGFLAISASYSLVSWWGRGTNSPDSVRVMGDLRGAELYVGGAPSACFVAVAVCVYSGQ